MRSLLILFAFAALAYSRVQYDGYQVLETVPKDEYQLRTLHNLMLTRHELDFWLEPQAIGHKVHIMVSPEFNVELAWTLEVNGMKVKVHVEDVQVSIDDELDRLLDIPSTRDYDYANFNRYADYMTELDQLASVCATGFTCTTGSAGSSTEGRDLKYIRIDTGTGGAGKPTFMIDSTTHAREWLSGATVMNIIRILLDQHPDYSGGSSYTERYNWVILPLVNPDGYEFSWDDDRLWRKSRMDNPGSQCIGTDLNRNYDYNWNTGGSSGNECSDTFHGGEPTNNPETQAIQDLAQAEQPFAFLSFHTYGEYWLEPYGDGSYTDNSAAHAAVTVATCDAIESTFNVANWQCGNSADVLYETSGTTADYVRGAVEGCEFSWTPELRGPGFIVSPAEIEPSTEEVWNGLKAKMDHPSFAPAL